MWPQLTMIALYVLLLGIGLAEHGQPKKGDENFFTTLLGAALMNGLLYAGGFYDGLIRLLGS